MSFKPIMVMDQIDLVETGYPMIPTTVSEDDFIVFRNKILSDRVDLANLYVNVEDEKKSLESAIGHTRTSKHGVRPIEVRPSNFNDSKTFDTAISSVTTPLFELKGTREKDDFVATIKADMVQPITTAWKEMKAKKMMHGERSEMMKKGLVEDKADVEKSIAAKAQLPMHKDNFKYQLKSRDMSGDLTAVNMTPIIIKSGNTKNVKVVEN